MILLPLLLFLAALVAVSFFAERHGTRHAFTSRYFLGDRTLNGFVLAMTLVATYGSVSSFVSGPGIAWNLGLGWVVFAAPQIIAGFLILGVAGKKLALVSRATGALTVVDVIRARYGRRPLARALALMLSVLMLVFFTTMIVGQFIGGAQIFSQAAGIDYRAALLLFGCVTVLYTAFGGFRAVAFTDMLCAILMLTGMFLLGAQILSEAGGFLPVMEKLSALASRGPGSEGAMMSPTAGGALGLPLLFSSWVLVGFGTLGLPQSAVRCMSYKTSADLNRAIVISTAVCGALMIGMPLLGVMMRAVMDVPLESLGTTDAIMPAYIATHMSPVFAGVTLIGPLAATMSTVSSLLLAASSAIVKDLLLMWRPDWESRAPVTLTRTTRAITALLGLSALVLAIWPLDVVAWINLFAFGGLELAFLLPLIGGLFWRRASAFGAMAGVVSGIGLYLLVSILKIPTAGLHAIVPAMGLSIVVFVAASLTGPKDKHSLEKFFPPRT